MLSIYLLQCLSFLQVSAGTVDCAKQTLESLLKQCNEPQANEVHKHHCHDGCKQLLSVFNMFFTLISGTKYCISEGKGAANHHTTSGQGNCFTKPNHPTTGLYIAYKHRITTSINTDCGVDREQFWV